MVHPARLSKTTPFRLLLGDSVKPDKDHHSASHDRRRRVRYRARMSPVWRVQLLLLPAASTVAGCAGSVPGGGREGAFVDYFVYSRDAPGVDDKMTALTPAHWDYMDRFADRLVARGPTLSAGGEAHTGSLHIVAVRDAGAARRFADEEPYQRAGLFAETTIKRYVNLLGRSMRDRPPAPDMRPSTFLLARWSAIPVDDRLVCIARDAIAARPDHWVFLGLLVTDDGTGCTGVAAAADADSAASERALRDVLEALRQEQAPTEVHRWQRGGRR